MKKQHAFIFALIITILIAINISFFSISFSPEREAVIISRVIDGDTLELKDGRTIRLLNINAPEKKYPNSNLATEFLRQFQNSTVEVEITGTDKYQRNLARVYAPDYLNLKIVQDGLASKFLVGESELKEFADAEESAIKNEKGIWMHSQYYDCIDTKIDRINEIVKLQNNCNNINILSWTIKDESTRSLELPNIEIGAINIHTDKGKDNETDIYWNSETNIWNNDRDSLFMFDEKSRIVSYNTYGY